MDDDCQSWEDRCNRYFSSLSDTEKDHGQEKHTVMTSREAANNIQDKVGDQPSVEANGGTYNTPQWRSLSEMRKLYTEHWGFRYTRRIMSVIDIHGAKASYRANSKVEIIVWLLIILAAVGVTAYLCYLIVIDCTRSDKVLVTTLENSNIKDGISITICNMNLLKRSLVTASSRFSQFTNSQTSAIVTNQTVPVLSLEDLVRSNENLFKFLKSNLDPEFNTVVDSLRPNFVIKEMMTGSSVPLVQRLLGYGRPDVLAEVLGVTTAEVEALGHASDDMLIDCWMDNRKCDTK